MTDENIKYKAFLVVWKVLRQGQSPCYFETERRIKQWMDGEITEEEFVEFYPEGVDGIVVKQKRINLNMFITALLATSDDRFERGKRLHPGIIAKLRLKR